MYLTTTTTNKLKVYARKPDGTLEFKQVRILELTRNMLSGSLTGMRQRRYLSLVKFKN